MAEPEAGDEVEPRAERVPFGELLQLGVLHVDRGRGEVLDAAAFERLLNGGYVVAQEEVTTDMDLLHYAFIAPDRMVPFLSEAGTAEGSGPSFLQRLSNNAWLHRTFQLPGGPVMDFFGNLALGMGVGSVVMFFFWRS